MNITDFLTRRSIKFQEVEHPATMDACRLAEALHVPGRQVAKTVLLRSDDGYVLAIVPATRHVDCESLQTLLGVRKLELATESEADELFPDVEGGVVPPFGSQYGVRTVVDVHLAACETIIFEGSTHREAVKMLYTDFEMLESPIQGMISRDGIPPRRPWAMKSSP